MESDFDRRLNDLLVEAFELPAEDRKPFLRRACDGDQTLYDEAVACLGHESEVGDFLETPALESRTGEITVEGRRTARTRSRRRPRDPEDDGMRIHLKEIGPYKILDRIGVGGMGVVYRAEDTRLERVVAIKFLAQDLDHDTRARSRFLREAKAAAKLEHPNICNVHEIGETPDGRPYIVMACYEGESLRQRLERGPLEVDDAVRIARQVASGLARAHKEGIVHRDVKPANVLLTHDDLSYPGRVKVLDFGIAKIAGDAGLTSPGRLIGTPYYMAPEQINGIADQRSDIWSLGVLFYEMVAGKRPFSGPRTINAVLREPPEPLEVERPGIPEFVYRIIARALEKDPDERYQRVEELVADLPIPLEESSVIITPADLRSLNRHRRSSLPLVATAALLVIALAVFGITWMRSVDSAAANRTEAAVAERPLMVVLPFTVRDDGGYGHLGEGMVELLSIKLGAGDRVRAIGSKAVLSELARRTSGEAPSEAEVVRRLGADLVVTGSVVEVAGQLRLNATVERVTAGETLLEGLKVADASVEGPASEAFSLVDALALQLLDSMGATGDPRPTDRPEI